MIKPQARRLLAKTAYFCLDNPAKWAVGSSPSCPSFSRLALDLGCSARLWGSLVVLVSALVFSLTSLSAFAQLPASDTSQSAAPVILEGQTLFLVYDKAIARSPQERALRISQRIEVLARDETVPEGAIAMAETEGGTTLYAQDILLMTVSDADAKAAEQPRQALAEQHASAIEEAVSQYRLARSAQYRNRAILITVLSTLALLLLLLVLANVMPQVYHWLDHQQDHWISSVRIQNFELLSSFQLSALLQTFTQLLHTVLVLGLTILYGSFVLGLFPRTRQLGNTLWIYLSAALFSIWQSFLLYLPNLLTLGLIGLVSYYLIRFFRLFFVNIRRGRVSLPGFYPEWANPTYQLLKCLILALSAAIAFPLLPGSSSPAFQGVSIFLGILVSLGSGGAIISVIAGFILVYTRAFSVGDRIRVGDIEGFVEEKSLFVTRIRTLNNLLVSVPNSTLLSSNIVNYSALLRDQEVPLIITTTVTLGYDVPWRTVHDTLIAAAIATPEVVADPLPEVWQTALNDFSISYELRACTVNPIELGRVYSNLHQSIQDSCNAAGIEIMSPHYTALRDGNMTTLPAQYLSPDYKPPGFRIKRVFEKYLIMPSA